MIVKLTRIIDSYESDDGDPGAVRTMCFEACLNLLGQYFMLLRAQYTILQHSKARMPHSALRADKG